MGKYLVVTTRQSGFNDTVKDAHYIYLEELRAAGQLEQWGPFSDKSGGAYILLAGDLAAATALAHADPVYITGASTMVIHEWNAK